MAVAPFVRGDADDNPDQPRGRIRNMRKLLVSAAFLMALLLLVAVSATAMLVPQAPMPREVRCAPAPRTSHTADRWSMVNPPW